MMSRITRFRRRWVAGLRHSRARQRDGDLMTLLSNAIAPGRGAADAGATIQQGNGMTKQGPIRTRRAVFNKENNRGKDRC
jgi:hypothetical protein